ncbi:transposase [Aeromonas hydrophila]
MVYTNGSRKGRANYSLEFKQRLVDAANQPGVSVSKLAQEHGVNANLATSPQWQGSCRLIFSLGLEL